MRRDLAWCLLPLALLAGCVFRDASEPRFYRPQATTLDGGGEPSASASGVAVRVQPVTGTPFLRERIVWRASDVEYGLYEQRRWSELPASYVQRALENALRETPGVKLSDELQAASLRVEVIAFDEVLTPPRHATVTLAVALRDRDRSRLLDRSFSAEAPIAGDATSATATAMGAALDQVAREVASAVAASVAAR